MNQRSRYDIDMQPIVRLNRNTVLSKEMVAQLIQNWGRHRQRYKDMDSYYTGVHDIVNRKYEDTNKPNNKLVNNFANYIVDVRTGYFTGVPITYTSNDQDLLDTLKDVFIFNNEEDVVAEIDRLTNIKGHAFELLWIDEDAQIRFKEIDPSNVIMIYSSDVACDPLYAIRYYDEIDPMTNTPQYKKVFVYSTETIQEYNLLVKDEVIDMALIEESNHYFGAVPIIEYLNNTMRMGSFEDVVTLMDAYNKAQSDTLNEIEYFADAYLKLKNMSATDTNDIATMKENRVLLVEGDGDAEWLTKNVNDTYIENIKERLTKDIHKFSKTPNLVSEQFVSNLSGTAIRYKVWGLEQDTSKKERRWKKSLMDKIEMICNILNAKGNQFDPKDVDFTFNRNLPQNVMELGQMVSQLRGTVSTETLLKQLPFVTNVKEEVKQLDIEAEKNQLNQYKIPTGSTAPNNNVKTPKTGENSPQATGESSPFGKE